VKLSYVIKKIRFAFIFSAKKRGEFLRKKGGLKEIGENIFFQPRKLPGDPELLRFKSNIAVASGVVFVTHDVMHYIFNNIEKNTADYHMGCIEVGNNVFIGANSVILPNVKIGDNCIIAAGSIVTKDVPSGSVVAGNPAKNIGDFYSVLEERKREFESRKSKSREQIVNELWEDFEKGKNRKVLEKQTSYWEVNCAIRHR